MFFLFLQLLIPTVSVVRVSKEKTGKIFPNAIGVATADERHVFGSFMSRESAFRLMLSVWRPVVSPEIEPEIVTKLPDVEISSIEDDSSCSASGNESPPRIEEISSTENSPSTAGGGASSSSPANDASALLSSTLNSVTHDDGTVILPNVPRKIQMVTTLTKEPLTGFKLPPPNVSPSPNNNFKQIKFKFPTDISVVYLGVILAVILSLFSGFLMYKIQDIQARTSGFSSFDFKLVRIKLNNNAF